MERREVLKCPVLAPEISTYTKGTLIAGMRLSSRMTFLTSLHLDSNAKLESLQLRAFH